MHEMSQISLNMKRPIPTRDRLPNDALWVHQIDVSGYRPPKIPPKLFEVSDECLLTRQRRCDDVNVRRKLLLCLRHREIEELLPRRDSLQAAEPATARTPITMRLERLVPNLTGQTVFASREGSAGENATANPRAESKDDEICKASGGTVQPLSKSHPVTVVLKFNRNLMADHFRDSCKEI
jgi:hypothetical protein